MTISAQSALQDSWDQGTDTTFARTEPSHTSHLRLRCTALKSSTRGTLDSSHTRPRESRATNGTPSKPPRDRNRRRPNRKPKILDRNDFSSVVRGLRARG